MVGNYCFSFIFGLTFLYSIYPVFQCHTEIKKDDKSSTAFSEHSQKEEKNNIKRDGETLFSNLTGSTKSIDIKTTLEESRINHTGIIPSNEQGQNATGSLPAWMTSIKSGALERTGFVALGFMLIIVLFFVIRGIRLRHKRSKSRKYGIITSTDMEMEPLDKDDDEEEDTTLFDAQHKYTLH